MNTDWLQIGLAVSITMTLICAAAWIVGAVTGASRVEGHQRNF